MIKKFSFSSRDHRKPKDTRDSYASRSPPRGAPEYSYSRSKQEGKCICLLATKMIGTSFSKP